MIEKYGKFYIKELSELILKAKGEPDDRSLRQYALDSGVSTSNISRIIRGEYKPSPRTLEMLTSPQAKPRGGVTHEALMMAAGYLNGSTSDVENIIGHYELYDDNEASLLLEEERRNAHRSRMRLHRERQSEFKRYALAITYKALALKGIAFANRERDIIDGYRPDAYVSVEGEYINKWFFEFRAYSDLDDDNKRMASRRAFDTFFRIKPDKRRKITLCIDNEEMFKILCGYKDNLAYKGDLSVALFNEKTLEVEKEVYIARYGEDSQNDIYMV